MSSGAGVIASNSEINKKLLDNKRGVIIDAQNPDNIASETLRLINNRYLVLDMGKQARQYVRKNYDWKSIVAQLCKEIA